MYESLRFGTTEALCSADIILEDIVVVYIQLNLLTFSAQDLLLSGLSQVSCDPSLECDRDISYDEVSCAAKQLNNSKAPGLDILPAEFDIAF